MSRDRGGRVPQRGWAGSPRRHRPPGHQVETDQCIRVIGYARVNGAPADQARLLALQWERMRRLVLEPAGWTIVGELSDITTRRPAGRVPGLRQALAEAVAGACDVFLVDSLDRVSRRICGFTAVVEELNRAGVTLRSAAESSNGGAPNGHFTLQALLALDEYERMRALRERAASTRPCNA